MPQKKKFSDTRSSNIQVARDTLTGKRQKSTDFSEESDNEGIHQTYLKSWEKKVLFICFYLTERMKDSVSLTCRGLAVSI